MTPKRLYLFFRPTLLAVSVFAVAVMIANWLQQRQLAAIQLGSEAPVAASDPGESATLQHPTPALDPEQVVELQLAALADPVATRGILQCMHFASPRNLAVTGPPSRFAQLVRRPPYDVLGRAEGFLIGQATYRAGSARVLVTLFDGNRPHTFVWVLRKQHTTPYPDCWLTDAVFRIGDPAEDDESGEAAAGRDDEDDHEPPPGDDSPII